jgi:endoglucanase Acf2
MKALSNRMSDRPMWAQTDGAMSLTRRLISRWAQGLSLGLKVSLAPALLLVFMGLAAAQGESVKLGAGSVSLKPRGADAPVPRAPYRTEAMLKRAAPTNQWYSSLIFNDKPENIYAQPLSFRPSAAGLEMALPKKVVVPTERKDVEIHYPHQDALTVSPVAFEPGRALLAGASDWAVDITMGRGADRFDATVAHGSPYAWFRVGRGDLRLRLPAAAERLTAADPRMLVLRVKGTSYALFGPTGVQWDSSSPTEWIARLPAGKGYLVASALPDDSPATQALLLKHAYAAVTDTRVEWKVDRATGEVQTTFTATTQALEGTETTALLGLYPHHWHANTTVEGRLGPAYDTVRGKVRLLAASSFRTSARYTGFVPYWPAVSEGAPRSADLKDVMKADIRNARRMLLVEGEGPYWQGKGLLRLLKMLDVYEQQGDKEASARLMELLKTRIEEWFVGTDRRRYFHWDQAMGTVVAYPEEYFAVVQMNDHHFHYGYWIRAVAEIALRDPAWAARGKWGDMVDLLIKDIAFPERGKAEFPFLRNFDAYEGHSWASGIGLGEHGNNQESSSEALNAWTGLILWGEVHGDAALRDLGIWLLVTETEAVKHYWFDLHKLVFAPEYKNADVSMVFGAKYAHNTWWIDDPRQITGINLLPMTSVSTYFASHPDYIRRNLATLKDEQKVWADRGKKVDPADIWQDIFAKYQALADPAAALAEWNRWGAVELGDSRTHTLHFLMSLAELGAPDTSITANTTLYQVFKRPDGRKTHLAFNAGKTPLTVRFSDGQQLMVQPGQLARSSAP